MKKNFVNKCLSMLVLAVMLVTLFPTNIIATENQNQSVIGEGADITAPTDVSIVSFVENGQTVKNGDDIHFIITAQDTESDISAEKSVVYVNGGSVDGISIKAVEGQANTYEITFGGSHFVEDGLNEINYIEIADAAGNVTSLDLVDENGNALYQFYGDFQEIDAVVTEIMVDTTEIVFDDNTTSFEVNIIATTDVDFIEEQYAELDLWFTSEEDEFYTIPFSLNYNVETGHFEGTEIINALEKIGVYSFEEAQLSFWMNDEVQSQTIEVVASSLPSITITKDFSDTEGPIFEKLYITKNGEIIENGFTVTAEDEIKLFCSFNENIVGIFGDERIEISILADLVGFGNLALDEARHDFDLLWNETLGMYETIIDVSNLYPTEWRFFINVYDIYGNTLGEDSKYGLCKYYFYFLENGTCVIPEYECEVVLENGDNTVTDIVTIHRMITLNELFPDGVPIPGEKSGEKFVGWSYRIVDNNKSDVDSGWNNFGEGDVIDIRKVGNLGSFGYMEPTIYVKPVYEKVENSTPDTETNPDTEQTPDSDKTPETEVTPESKPVIKLNSETIAKTVENISASAEGTQITIDMSKEDGTVATVVPAEILEAARENGVNIVLNMGTYSWSINSDDILDGNLTDINLEVTMDTNAIPSATVDTLANGKRTRQLSLTHNGEFRFKASLTINVGSEYEGEFGNLYYHDSTGKLVFMNAGKIQKDGTVTVNFSHASDYVIIIGEDRTANPIVESPNTGDTQGIVWILFVATAVILGKRILKLKRF